jgi:ferritin-like metal-binding protein YciE
LTGKESAKLAAEKEAANAFRSVLAETHPNIDKLNKEFTFLNNVQEVVGETIKRTKSQSSLVGELTTDTGAVVGATIKGTVGSVAQWGIMAKVLSSTVKSTGWRTASAITKNSLANLLARGELAKATTLLQKLANPKSDTAR